MTDFLPFTDAGVQRRLRSLRVIALVVLAIGVGWADCILVAVAVAIAATSHERARSARVPREGWRIACDCWLTTLIYVCVGLMLVLMVGATEYGNRGSHAAPLPRLVVFLVAAGSAILVTLRDQHRFGLLSLSVVTVGGAMLLGWQPSATGCAVALLVFGGLMARAWYLSRVVAPFLLRNEQRY